jgi:signal transduction histidine kinase
METMDLKTRARIVELLLASIAVVAAVIWAQQMAWSQISSLRREIRAEELDRFRSADELRASILERHALWRQALERSTPESQAALDAARGRLEALIQAKAKSAESATERELIEQIEAGANVSPAGNEAVEKQEEAKLAKLLALTEKLTALNRAEAQRFLWSANEGLTRLQRFLFAAVLCFLASGVTLLVLAYRRMIAPLSSTLTENRATIERQEKLASLGVFATGIAHEIRNPLTAIKVRLFSLKQSHRPGTSEHEDVQVIGAEIDRLERIVKEFLQFARPAEPNLRPMPARKLLVDICELLETELARKSIILRVETTTEATVRVDPNKMKQVLINLVQNAADSIAAEGQVTLRAREEKRLLYGHPTRTVVLDVSDTGSGMPVEVQKRLFDPFFTTKEDGTGLGLPIAARIVEKHGGIMEYKTQTNRGTTFSVVLPTEANDERTIQNPAR